MSYIYIYIYIYIYKSDSASKRIFFLAKFLNFLSFFSDLLDLIPDCGIKKDYLKKPANSKDRPP